MSTDSAWPEILESLEKLPFGCFDGYFAEGISDTVARKMNRDWPALMNTIPAYLHNEKVRSLLLESLNDADLIEDLRATLGNAESNCGIGLGQFCEAVSRRIHSLALRP